MCQSLNQEQSPQSAVSPSEYLKARSLQPKNSAHFGGVDIYHIFQPPSEVEETFSHHLIVSRLNKDWHTYRPFTRFAGNEYTGSLDPFNVVLLPAKTYAFFSCSQPTEMITFAVEPTVLQQIAIETGCLNPNRVELQPIVHQTDPKLAFFAQCFKEEIENNAFGGRLYGESLTNLFAIHLLRCYCAFEPKLKQYQGGLSTHKLQQAIDFIQTHLAEDVSLAAIAKALDMSQYYFCRLFKQSTGVSPYQYLIQQRIERAKQLLQQSTLSVTEVAQAVGFSEQGQLTRHLKRATGLTPRQLRK